jgi:hypothetical protein
MSGIATGTALLVGAAVSAAGGVAGGMISANAAGKAAQTQANAADYAANLQAQTANTNLQYQGNLSNAEIANQQPWYQSGEGALSDLDYGLGISPGAAAQGVNVPQMNLPGGAGSPFGTNGQSSTGGTSGTGLTPNAASGSGITPSPGNTGLGQGQLEQGWNQTFQAPTGVTEANDPGYQFRLQQGAKALNLGAAASGNLLTGGTANALQQYGQNFGSNEYQNVYNRALEGYGTNFNTFEANQANQYNRLASVAGVGQTAANTINNGLANSGQQVGSTLSNAATQIGQQGNNAAAAMASGYVGSANAYGGALNNLGNQASQYAMLQSLTKTNNPNPYNNPNSPLYGMGGLNDSGAMNGG